MSRGSLLSMPAVGVAGAVRALVWSTQTVTVSVPDFVPLYVQVEAPLLSLRVQDAVKVPAVVEVAALGRRLP